MDFDYGKKKIKECSFTQLYTYKMNHLKDIYFGRLEFPKALLFFLDSPALRDMNPKEKNKELRKVVRELAPEIREMEIEIEPVYIKKIVDEEY